MGEPYGLLLDLPLPKPRPETLGSLGPMASCARPYEHFPEHQKLPFLADGRASGSSSAGTSQNHIYDHIVHGTIA